MTVVESGLVATDVSTDIQVRNLHAFVFRDLLHIGLTLDDDACLFILECVQPDNN